MIRRRHFVLAAAGALLGVSARRLLAQTAKGRLGAIGVQLYTLRGAASRNLAKTLADVAKAGYQEVEFAGYFGHPAPEVRKMLDDNGLKSPASHVSMENLGNAWPIFLEDANVLGQKYLVVGWIDAPNRTYDGYKKIAHQLNEAALIARGENIHLGYHNYSYEFTPLRDGLTGYDILIRDCPPENLALEADVFWMRQAKQDPLKWFAKYPGRFHMLHVKDMGPSPKNRMLDVGKGVVDWRAILSRRGPAGVRHVFVEHDEAVNPVASIRASYRYLRALRFKEV